MLDVRQRRGRHVLCPGRRRQLLVAAGCRPCGATACAACRHITSYPNVNGGCSVQHSEASASAPSNSSSQQARPSKPAAPAASCRRVQSHLWSPRSHCRAGTGSTAALCDRTRACRSALPPAALRCSSTWGSCSLPAPATLRPVLPGGIPAPGLERPTCTCSKRGRGLPACKQTHLHVTSRAASTTSRAAMGIC